MSKDDYLWLKENGEKPQDVDGITLQLMQPKKKSYLGYYNVIANPMLWFIQHQLWDTPRNPSITQETWDAWDHGYVEINKAFAQTVAETVKDETRSVLIFPQDYHLYLMPHFLREMLGDKVQIQPFIHIPWPGPDAWRVLPGQIRKFILTSLLRSDRVGFQTQKDAFNFVQTCRLYLEGAHSRGTRDTIHYDAVTDKPLLSGTLNQPPIPTCPSG